MNIMKKSITLASFFFALWCMPHLTFAAAFSFAPSTNTYRVNDTFAVGVYAEGIDRAVNAASGVISFPASRLEVVSVSKSGSLLTLWIKEPSFSNTAGTVSFEGIVPNPGFAGASGRLLTVTFKVKSTGTGTIAFSSGSLLANDGHGTNILNKLGSVQVTLSDAVQAKPLAPIRVPTKPSVPKNTSTTSKTFLPQNWSQSLDTHFANLSETSDGNVTASVPQSPFMRFTDQTINILSRLVQIVALIFMLLFLGVRGWHYLLRHHKGLRKRVCEIDTK